MVESFEDDKFAAAIELIVKARKIVIIGLRSSYPLAYYLGFYLRLIRDYVSTAGNVGHTLAEDLSLLQKGDLLIAISLKPYTKDTVDACRVARQQKLDIIAITDSVSSPLASEAENILITYIEKDYFFTPIAAAILCIETILSAVVKRLGDKASRRLHHTEHILDKMEIET
jgi:DNA-binding MurR/RpiR family transcriptional regulator